MKTPLIAAVAAVAIAGGVVASAPAAHAYGDNGEDTSGYLHALSRDGIDIYPTSRSIYVGEGVCTKLRSGESEAEIIDWLVDPPRPIDRRFAVTVVTEAHLFLCPDAATDGGEDS
jgi:hypothetical protein